MRWHSPGFRIWFNQGQDSHCYPRVKRTFAALDNQVVRRHRVSFAGVELGDLPVGKHRLLTPEEILALRGGAHGSVKLTGA